MLKKLSKVPFNGTAEQEEKLTALIRENQSDSSRLMKVMQGAQEIYGYLPLPVQERIAEGMGVSLEKVYGVATFYSQFSLSPKGNCHIAVCLGTACYVKGSGLLADKIHELVGIDPGETSADGVFSFEATRCIGACGLAPVLTVNGDVYGRLTPQDLPAILDKYR